MAEHRPARSESLQPHTERSSRPDSEPPSAEVDILVVHARKEEEDQIQFDVALMAEVDLRALIEYGDSFVHFSPYQFYHDALLWSPYVIGQTIIFLPCDF